MSDALKLQFLIEAIDGTKSIVGGIAGGVRSAARDIAGSFAGAGRAMEGFSHSYAGIATAIGGGLEIRDLIGDEDTFNRLRVQYGMTETAIGELHESIVGAAKDAKVNLRDMLGAVSGFKEGGGAVAQFGEDAKTAAAAIQLLGGQGDDVGRMMASLHKQLAVDDITRSVAALYEQTKNVPGGFSQLAAQINPLAAQYAALGHTGTEAAREIGAVYAVIADGAKSGRQAAAELTQLLEALKTPDGRVKIGSAIGGVAKVSSDIYDPKNVSPITDIVRSIGEAYQRDPKRTAMLLGPQLANDLKTLIAQPGLLDQKLAATGDPRKFFEDAAQASNSLTASLNQLKTSIDQIGETWLARPFKWMAGAISYAHNALGLFIAALGGLTVLGYVVPILRGSWQGWVLLGRAALWFAVTAIPAVIGAVTTVAEVIATASAAMLATPFGVILAGVAAVAAALLGLYELWNHWREIRDSMTAGMMQPDGGIVDPNTGVYIPGSAFTGSDKPPSRTDLAPPRPDRAPAFGGAAPAGGAANNQVNGQVVVTFEGAPANLTTRKVESDNPNVDIDVNMGYGMTMVP